MTDKQPVSPNQGGEFRDQGGIATMDPNPLRRWVISKIMTVLASESRMLKKRAKAEKYRIKKRLPHVVEYFHQVDDGYSHLCSQFLERLAERYDIELVCHLVSGPTGLDVAEPKLLNNLAVVDAKRIAPYYDATFAETDDLPSKSNIKLTQSIIAHQTPDTMPACIARVSKSLWEHDFGALQAYSAEYGVCNQSELDLALKKGNDRLHELKHYSSAMFYYAGEWYWGLDRLHYLEDRLIELEASTVPHKPLVSKRQIPIHNDSDQPKHLKLEIYASLRSPYTAIVFDRAIKLAINNKIDYVIKPVLPMVMRGVPATKNKGFYICFDTAREARTAKVPYGKVYDPIGQPARYGYALYYWACKHGKGEAFFSNFLRAAFVEAINTNRLSGLKYVVENTGLIWSEAKLHLNDNTWQDKLEENRMQMYGCGIWGVPSFRLLNKYDEEILSVWGQDRMWLVEETIRKHNPI